MHVVEARRRLEALLAAYDHANRLAIDALYAQFSPTLDDFYAEELRIVFPPRHATAASGAPGADGAAARGETLDAGDRFTPELILTRTVPGQEPKSVRSTGAPFPLAHACRLVRAALSDSPGAGAAAATALNEGRAFLAPVQVLRTQRVVLHLVPGGTDVIGLLA